jgi:FMN phosphatase YigB (HAD superfamily)
MISNSKIVKTSLNTQIKAILFDLDGTLLHMDFEKFIPSFFKSFARYFSNYYDSDDLEEKLRGINELLLQNAGNKTNVEVFKEEFYRLFKVDIKVLDFMISEFFDFVFPKLQKHVKSKPDACSVVNTAFNCGYDVIIATNPIFPVMAARHRLNWVDLGNFPYTLITGLENCSAVKPNLLFFKEIFSKIDRNPSECLMVGDMNMDIVAAKLGCPTFFMADSNVTLKPSTPKPTYIGTLKDLETLIKNTQFGYDNY